MWSSTRWKMQTSIPDGARSSGIDGQRLSIEQSAERIHAWHRDTPYDQIEIHVVGWLESYAPESYSERQLEELDRLTEPWLDDYQRKSQAARE